jgi:hypothetical protein
MAYWGVLPLAAVTGKKNGMHEQEQCVTAWPMYST